MAKQAKPAAKASAKTAPKASAKPAAKASAKPAPAAKPGTIETADVWQCRVIVRGRTEKGGAILRAVRTVEVSGADVAQATTNAAKHAEKSGLFASMASERGFVETTTATIYPPVGLLVRGGVSKGFGVLPGAEKLGLLPVFVARTHKAGDPVPADLADKYIN